LLFDQLWFFDYKLIVVYLGMCGFLEFMKFLAAASFCFGVLMQSCKWFEIQFYVLKRIVKMQAAAFVAPEFVLRVIDPLKSRSID
jgi:hypothetical protein